MADQTDVRDNPAEGRFETTVDGHLAIAEYVRQGDTIIFTHTFVPEQLRGQGVADKLAHYALGQAREQGLKVVPRCPFFAAFIRRHSEYQPLVDWGADEDD